MQISRPAPNEHLEFHNDYIGRVPLNADIDALLASQPLRLRALLRDTSDAAAATPHKAGEWTIKQVLGHLSDGERVLSYRLLCIARGDKNHFPGFEQDDYARTGGSNSRTVSNLLDEFGLVRDATLALVRSLPQNTHTIIGHAGPGPLSVRALLHIMPGHVENHIAGLKTDYGLTD